MKVKELSAKLSEVDPELEIVCYTEDAALVLPDQLFRLLTIESVDVAEGQQVRDDQRVPTLKLGRSPESQPIAFLNVTGQFYMSMYNPSLHRAPDDLRRAAWLRADSGLLRIAAAKCSSGAGEAQPRWADTSRILP